MKVIFSILFALMLNSCGINFAAWHVPYMLPVEQGKIIDSEQMAKIHEGMTKDEVIDIIGEPLNTFLFTDNEWDFIYQCYKNYSLKQHDSLVLLFNNNIVSKIINNAKSTKDLRCHYSW